MKELPGLRLLPHSPSDSEPTSPPPSRGEESHKLGREEELALITEYQQAMRARDLATDAQARTLCQQRAQAAAERLVTDQQPSILATARRYSKNNSDLVTSGDLINAGNEGLLEALRRYNSKHGCRLSTYASWWIQNKIDLEVRAHKWNMGISDPTHKQLMKLLKIHRDLYQEYGRDPTRSELACSLNWPVERINKLMAWKDRDVVSLDQLYQKYEDLSLPESLSVHYQESGHWDNVETSVERVHLYDELDEALENKLTDRERFIMRLFFGICFGDQQLTLSEIGEQLGITYERVRQLREAALRKLREDRSLAERGGFVE